MKHLLVIMALILVIGCKNETTETTTETVKSNKKNEKIINYREYSINNSSSITITDNGIMANIKPFIPKLAKGEYQFVGFYNISNQDHYAVLCVLEMVGVRDVNLIEYDPAAVRSYMDITPKSFNLTGDNIETYFGKKDFKNLQSGDKVTVICYHDDDFENTNSNDRVLNYYRENLPYIYVSPDHYTSPEKEPKKGNGGVLTVQ